jgi:hypothetical protein
MADEQTPTRSEELLAKSRAGEKLETDQRRDLIAYLMVVQPELTNSDMARMFGLSEGGIRKDKEVIRKKAAEELSGEDVGLVIADIRRTLDRFKRDMEKALKACEPGTKVYLEYQKALVDYEFKGIEALQSLGFYPKNLGVLQKNQFVFKSIVSKDGSIDTRAIDAKDAKVIEGQRSTTKALIASSVVDPEDAALRAALREEFSETPTSMRDVTPSEDEYVSDGA